MNNTQNAFSESREPFVGSLSGEPKHKLHLCLSEILLKKFFVTIGVFIIYLELCSAPFLRADFSRDEAGTSAAQFLKLGAGARAEGLAGAYGSVSEDATAIYWNPAGLSQLESQNASFMHAVYVESIYYDFATYSLPVGKNVGLGAGVQYVSYGGVEETTEEGLSAGTFDPQNLALSLGGGYRWECLSVGSAIKYVRGRIKENASTATVDVGLLYHIKSLTFGFSIQNIFSYLTFDRDAYQLPLNLKVSSSLRPSRWFLLSADLNLPRDYAADVSLGVEKSFKLSEYWTISPRGGYSTRTKDLSGFRAVTAGFGIASKIVSLDYAWMPLGDFGQTHRISMSVTWGNRRN